MNRMLRGVFVASFLLAALPAPLAAADQDRVKAALARLPWRNIGPANMGGRVDDFAVVESDPDVVYAGTASGGVWKSTNRGVTWRPVFDDQPVSSIGDITVAPSDPSIVWVGTGEANNRQSSSWGHGVYKSMDGGRSWRHVGLDETHHIGRIVIHPSDPETVYVAAVGHLWGANAERGLYRTTDGGASWRKVLFVNEDTGVIDVAMDPVSPRTLYAAAYQRRRTAFGFSGSGPGSGLFRSTDGGDTWHRLSGGLPEGEMGRIGIDIYRKDPRIVYAVVESFEGGVFRSEDRGESWKKMSETNPRPMYYSQIRVDPQNDQRIWVLGARMSYSEDGGVNFATDRVTEIHGDHHALWIDPADSDHMVLGSDGGIHFSFDRGLTWDFVNTIALGQFYEVGYDMAEPYHIYGGLQDNGSWGGPVRTPFRQGITNEDWRRIGGGDGFYVRVDPKDPTTIYAESQNGNVFRLNTVTTETKRIRPQEEPGEPRYRFDWNSPMLISAHDSNTIYYGGNRLFKSTTRGDSWTRSPDLTRNQDRDQMPIMGEVPTRENTLSAHDGISTFGQIITIAESPVRQGVLWAGTDDGNVQVSVDGGRNWKNVVDNVPGVPSGSYVSRVEASHAAAGRAYVTFDGHRSDEFGVYVFRTDDYGESWQAMTHGIAEGHTANVIREHPSSEDLLFLGTEFGAYVSFDRGGFWHRLGGGLPTVPVDDIAIHPRDHDLILGTHGRSIWVLDDITFLEELTRAVDSELFFFPVRSATAYRIYNHKGNTGHKLFQAPNPPAGAMLHYYSAKDDEEAEVKFTVRDRSGKVVRELEGPVASGMNRVVWDLRHDSPFPREQQGNRFFGGFGGPRVMPGQYEVTLAFDGKELQESVDVFDDPRIDLTASERNAYYTAVTESTALLKELGTVQQRNQKLNEQLQELLNAIKGAEGAEEVRSQIEEVQEKMRELGRTLGASRGRGRGGNRNALMRRVSTLYSGLNGHTAPPTEDESAELSRLKKETADFIGTARDVFDNGVKKLNESLQKANLVFRVES